MEEYRTHKCDEISLEDVGKKVSIRITLANNATHCVITQISQK